MDRLLLIDGSNLLFQMFFGMPARIVNSKGKAIHGTLGFVGALLKIIRMVQPSHVAVLFDGEHENPRCILDEGYKANRAEDERLKEGSPFSQLEDIYRALNYLDLRYAETTNCETDDWMAGYAKRYGNDYDIFIVSMDSDYFQLVSQNVHILRYRGKKTIICDEEYIRQRLGIEPGQYADYKSMTGDAADNIPGVPGVGPKTAARLLRDFGTLDEIVAQIDNVQRTSIRSSLMENIDRMQLNRQLVRLDDVKDLPFTPPDLEWKDKGYSTVQVLSEIGLY